MPVRSDGPGIDTTPTAYTPDSLWSYELGAKDSLFGGRLSLDSSVYALKWKSIQQSVQTAVLRLLLR